MSITKTVLLRCSVQRAFELFTQQAGLWWPGERRHTKDAASVIVMEASGRFYERSSAGVEVELGRVREFMAPTRLALDWYPGTGPEHPTKVEVDFAAVPEGTLVTVTHGPGAAGTERFDRSAPAYQKSWDLVLAALVAHADALAQR